MNNKERKGGSTAHAHHYQIDGEIKDNFESEFRVDKFKKMCVFPFKSENKDNKITIISLKLKRLA